VVTGCFASQEAAYFARGETVFSVGQHKDVKAFHQPQSQFL